MQCACFVVKKYVGKAGDRKTFADFLKRRLVRYVESVWTAIDSSGSNNGLGIGGYGYVK